MGNVITGGCTDSLLGKTVGLAYAGCLCRTELMGLMPIVGVLSGLLLAFGFLFMC